MPIITAIAGTVMVMFVILSFDMHKKNTAPNGKWDAETELFRETIDDIIGRLRISEPGTTNFFQLVGEKGLTDKTFETHAINDRCIVYGLRIQDFLTQSQLDGSKWLLSKSKYDCLIDDIHPCKDVENCKLCIATKLTGSARVPRINTDISYGESASAFCNR